MRRLQEVFPQKGENGCRSERLMNGFEFLHSARLELCGTGESKLEVSLCRAEAPQITLQALGQTRKPGRLLARQWKHVPVLHHVGRLEVTEVDPDVVFDNRGDATHILHDHEHEVRALIHCAACTDVSADPDMICRGGATEITLPLK